MYQIQITATFQSRSGITLKWEQENDPGYSSADDAPDSVPVWWCGDKYILKRDDISSISVTGVEINVS